MMYFLIRAGIALGLFIVFIICLKILEWIMNKIEDKYDRK